MLKRNHKETMGQIQLILEFKMNGTKNCKQK